MIFFLFLHQWFHMILQQWFVTCLWTCSNDFFINDLHMILTMIISTMCQWWIMSLTMITNNDFTTMISLRWFYTKHNNDFSHLNNDFIMILTKIFKTMILNKKDVVFEKSTKPPKSLFCGLCKTIVGRKSLLEITCVAMIFF